MKYIPVTNLKSEVISITPNDEQTVKVKTEPNDWSEYENQMSGRSFTWPFFNGITPFDRESHVNDYSTDSYSCVSDTDTESEMIIHPKILNVYSMSSKEIEDRQGSLLVTDLNGNVTDKPCEIRHVKKQRNGVLLKGEHCVVGLEDIGRFCQQNPIVASVVTQKIGNSDHQKASPNIVKQADNWRKISTGKASQNIPKPQNVWREIKTEKRNSNGSLPIRGDGMEKRYSKRLRKRRQIFDPSNPVQGTSGSPGGGENSINVKLEPKDEIEDENQFYPKRELAETVNEGKQAIKKEKAEDNGNKESIVWRCFKKLETEGDGQLPKKGKNHRVVECSMCGSQLPHHKKSMLEHLQLKHNVKNTDISSDTVERMNEWKDVLQKKNLTRNPSTAGDYFVKMQDIQECILCDFTNLHRPDGSTYPMLRHLHRGHNYDHRLLPLKCMCKPTCK